MGGDRRIEKIAPVSHKVVPGSGFPLSTKLAATLPCTCCQVFSLEERSAWPKSAFKGGSQQFWLPMWSATPAKKAP
jgi:hypothetical protein